MDKNIDLVKQVVLCVDDSELIHTVLDAALNRDFEVYFETKGVNTLDRAIKVQPDLILLDYHMPEINGVEVLKNIKSHPSLDHIPILFLTGSEDSGLQQSLTSMGASGLILKPINVKSLAGDLKKIIRSFSILKESSDKFRKVFINQHSKEEIRLINEAIQLHLELKKQVVVISLNGGDQFMDRHPSFSGPLLKGDLTYLQVKPALLARISYLEDMLSIKTDLAQLFTGDLKEIFWIVLQPDILFDFGHTENSRSVARSFNIFAEKYLGEVSYFLSMRGFPDEKRLVNQLASILCA